MLHNEKRIQFSLNIYSTYKVNFFYRKSLIFHFIIYLYYYTYYFFSSTKKIITFPNPTPFDCLQSPKTCKTVGLFGKKTIKVCLTSALLFERLNKCLKILCRYSVAGKPLAFAVGSFETGRNGRETTKIHCEYKYNREIFLWHLPSNIICDVFPEPDSDLQPATLFSRLSRR